MSYADIDDYIDLYKDKISEPINRSEIERLLEDATFEVDELCYGRIRAIGFDNLTKYQKKLIRRSVCNQAYFKSVYGDYLDMPLSGYNIGDVGLQFSEDNKGPNGIYASSKVFQLLNRTGLNTRRL